MSNLRKELNSEFYSFNDPRDLLLPHPELSRLLYTEQEGLGNRPEYDQKAIERSKGMSEEMLERCEQAEEIRVKEEEEQRKYKAAMKAVYGMQWGAVVDRKPENKNRKEGEEKAFTELEGEVTAAGISALEEIKEEKGNAEKAAGIAVATILAGNLLLSACTPAEATKTPIERTEPTFTATVMTKEITKEPTIQETEVSIPTKTPTNEPTETEEPTATETNTPTKERTSTPTIMASKNPTIQATKQIETKIPTATVDEINNEPFSFEYTPTDSQIKLTLYHSPEGQVFVEQVGNNLLIEELEEKNGWTLIIGTNNDNVKVQAWVLTEQLKAAYLEEITEQTPEITVPPEVIEEETPQPESTQINSEEDLLNPDPSQEVSWPTRTALRKTGGYWWGNERITGSRAGNVFFLSQDKVRVSGFVQEVDLANRKVTVALNQQPECKNDLDNKLVRQLGTICGLKTFHIPESASTPFIRATNPSQDREFYQYNGNLSDFKPGDNVDIDLNLDALKNQQSPSVEMIRGTQ